MLIVLKTRFCMMLDGQNYNGAVGVDSVRLAATSSMSIIRLRSGPLLRRMILMEVIKATAVPKRTSKNDPCGQLQLELVRFSGGYVKNRALGDHKRWKTPLIFWYLTLRDFLFYIRATRWTKPDPFLNKFFVSLLLSTKPGAQRVDLRILLLLLLLLLLLRHSNVKVQLYRCKQR